MFQLDFDIECLSMFVVFLKDCGMGSYEEFVICVNDDFDWFWGKMIDLVGICFSYFYKKLRDILDGLELI